MATQKFPIHFLWWIVLVLTNYAQLLLYISYEQANLHMLVTTKAFLVAVTRAQVLVALLRVLLFFQAYIPRGPTLPRILYRM